jgi:hypothetical protein
MLEALPTLVVWQMGEFVMDRHRDAWLGMDNQALTIQIRRVLKRLEGEE